VFFCRVLLFPGLDNFHRERIYVLTIAAEEGWKTASDYVFNKTGNLADKDLAKALKKKEKRKKEAKE